MDITKAIGALLDKKDLSADEMESVMDTIMSGGATDAQIGGLLIALRMKGETIDEIVGAAKVMRNLSTKVEAPLANLVDTCGTGGDGINTFNISTCSAFVVAAAGAKVAKHGNRSVSSSCGSADLLEKAGVNLGLRAEQVGRCISELGIGFMFAPAHHGAMKYAIGPRKEMGVRTIFNVLGPLTNPASAPNQVLGVFSKELLVPLAKALQSLGSDHVLVVHSADGMDEISIGAETFVAELKDGEVTEFSIKPEDFGLQTASLDVLKVADADESLTMINQVLDNEDGPAKDIVVLNSGAALYAANVVGSITDGVALAQDVIATGQAKEKLAELVDFSQSC